MSGRRGWIGGAAARMAMFALAAGVVVALRLIERGEAPSPRTQELVRLAMLAGLPAGACIFVPIGWLMSRVAPWLRLAAAAVLAIPAFGGFVFLAFAVSLKLLNGRDLAFADRHHHWGHELVGEFVDAAGFFVVTGQKYLAAWPLAAIAAAAGLLAAWPWSARPLSRPAPHATAPARPLSAKPS